MTDNDALAAIRKRAHRDTGYAPTQRQKDILYLLGQLDVARADADRMAEAAEALRAALMDNRSTTVLAALDMHRAAVALRGAK